MFYVYCIKSLKTGYCYIGYTSDLKRRFKEHNEGKSKYTRNHRPFELVYYEAYKSKKDAQQRERALKIRSNAYIQLRKRIKNSLNED